MAAALEAVHSYLEYVTYQMDVRHPWTREMALGALRYKRDVCGRVSISFANLPWLSIA